MEVVNAFPGRAPTVGLMLAARVYNDTTDPWKDDEGAELEWRQGVQVRRSACTGVHAHPVNCATAC